jgi:hypothetical protein
MFCKKKKDDSITAIEQRVCDLENPYKFEIGNEVSVEYELKFKYINGKIVSKRHKYESPYTSWTSDFMYVSNNKIKFLSHGNYKRINYYLIYIEEYKDSVWRSENELSDKIKKK